MNQWLLHSLVAVALCGGMAVQAEQKAPKNSWFDMFKSTKPKEKKATEAEPAKVCDTCRKSLHSKKHTESPCNWLAMQRNLEHGGYYNKDAANASFERMFPGGPIYQTPTWPFFARSFLKQDLFSFDVDFGFANKALYGGRTKDISALVFGKETVQIQDILMASRLLAQDSVAMYGANPDQSIANVYKVYAPQELRFQASHNYQKFNFNYAHHFWNGNLVCGLQVPLIRKSNRIKMTIPEDATLNADYNALTAEAKNAFTAQYSAGLSDFVADILQRKNLTLNHTNNDIGFGDITFFFNSNYHSKFCHESTFGMQLTAPVGKSRDSNKIWAPDLGNGGFAQLAGHIGFQWHCNLNWLNPHLYSRLAYSFMGSVDRRVPAVRNYQGADPGKALAPRYDASANPQAIGYMLYGEDVNFIPARHFTEPDATIREFADHAMRVRIRPGIEWGFKVGNVFEHLFSRRMFIDLYYEFALKAKDSLGFHRDDELLFRDVLTRNTATQAHIIGGMWNYQIDDTYRVNLGAQYLFAGRNMLKTVSVDVGVSIEF